MTSLDDQVKVVSQKAENVKATIYRALHKEYSDLFPSKAQQELLTAVRPLLKDMQKLGERFEGEVTAKVKAVTSHHKDLIDEYNKTKAVTNVLQSLCTCHKELSLCKSTGSNNFVKSATHLQTVKTELDTLISLLSSTQSHVKIVKVIRDEFVNQETKMQINLQDAWRLFIVWKTSSNASWDSIDGHLKTSLEINCVSSGIDVDVVGLVEAMNLTNILKQELKSFSHKFYTYVLKPVAKFQNLVPVTQVKENKCYTLKITKRVGNQKITKFAQHGLLYKKLLDVVQFIRSTLFHDLYQTENVNVDPMAIVGSYIWKDISEMIIKEHLSVAVPGTNSSMEKYESSIKDTIQFEFDLIKEGFIPAGTNVLSQYVKDVNVHFANKICQDILSEARDLMLCEIHNMVKVDWKVDRASISLSLEQEGEILNKTVKAMLSGIEAIEDEFLHVDMFAFANCLVSDSVQKLLDFVYQTLIKATDSQFPMASQMFYCCRDIFEMYINIVPTYHKDNLKLPQLAAVHYNNCMYLAHHCITLGHQFRNSLPEQLNSKITTFVDLVPVIRRCGTTCFLEQLRTQQRELVCILEACGNFTECTSEGGIASIRKAFNQVIHHLTRIAKVWDKVLPVNIFKQSIAILFNFVLETILSSIFKMEDISVNDAGQLHVLLSILVSRAPEVIQSCSPDIVDTGINEHIRSWKKFEYFIKMLEASLQEIVEWWDNGQGELAACMNEGEVRNLVRALFQNTDRRSQALSKIKYRGQSN